MDAPLLGLGMGVVVSLWLWLLIVDAPLFGLGMGVVKFGVYVVVSGRVGLFVGVSLVWC